MIAALSMCKSKRRTVYRGCFLMSFVYSVAASADLRCRALCIFLRYDASWGSFMLSRLEIPSIKISNSTIEPTGLMERIDGQRSLGLLANHAE